MAGVKREGGGRQPANAGGAVCRSPEWSRQVERVLRISRRIREAREEAEGLIRRRRELDDELARLEREFGEELRRLADLRRQGAAR